MKATYQLSNRQRKELLTNGRVLSLAIPDISDRDCSLEDYALAAVPELERGWIVAAKEAMVPVAPNIRSDGLAKTLGEIQHRLGHAERWHILVACVVIELQAVRVARHPIGLTQWPGSVEYQ